MKNCHFARKYAPPFKKNILQQNSTAQKTSVVAGKFFVFESTFECAPKVISTGAAFFAKRLGIAFTFQTDVRSRWGKNLRTPECSQRFVEPVLAVLLKFSAESPSLLQLKFLGSHKILIVLKTFLTNTAALPKCRKHERSFRRELRKKNLVILEIKKCSKAIL